MRAELTDKLYSKLSSHCTDMHTVDHYFRRRYICELEPNSDFAKTGVHRRKERLAAIYPNVKCGTVRVKKTYIRKFLASGCSPVCSF